MSRLLIPQLSFADLQLQSQGVHLDATLQGIANFLEKHSALVELVRKDLERGLKKPKAGRNGISPEQTLRSLTLMRVKNWDYRELAERINDGYTLRSFTLFDTNAVHSATSDCTLHCSANCTVHATEPVSHGRRSSRAQRGKSV